MSEAYVTLATDDRYAIGALVLAHSLKAAGTTRDVCILISPAITPSVRFLLEDVFTSVIEVNILDSKDSAHLSMLKRPELGVTFTKLHCWTLTQYSKCVFLDADMLAIGNPDELFSHPELSATSDVGWPDCFNSGMFVFVPSQETYAKLLSFAEDHGSFDGGDQGLLNSFFTDWKRVSFIFNMVASAIYTYLPAYKQYGSNVRLVHFLGQQKPWHCHYDQTTGAVSVPGGYDHLVGYLQRWWTLYHGLVAPSIPKEAVTGVTDVHFSNHIQQPSMDTRRVCSVPVQQTFPIFSGVQNILSLGVAVSLPAKSHAVEYSKGADVNHSHIFCPHPSVSLHPGAVLVQSEPPQEQHATPKPINHMTEQVTYSATDHRGSEGNQTLHKTTDIVEHECTKDAASGHSEVHDFNDTVINKSESETSRELLYKMLSDHTHSEDAEVTVSAWKYRSGIKGNPAALASQERLKDATCNEIADAALIVSPEPEPGELAETVPFLYSSADMEHGRRQWEEGYPEYLGRDSFENIMAYITAQLDDTVL